MLRRLAVIAVVIVVVVALIAWYVVGYLMVSPATVSLPSANLTLQTVAGLGDGYTEPTWVSYLVKDEKGKWQHSTIFKVPAHALVHVTVYQYDGASGLRNPFLARLQGVEGNVMQVDGKTVDVIDPDDASHTFAVAAYHLVVPLVGVADDAKNQCEQAPCGLDKAHRTITFIVPHRRARATTAGSASCRAPPASSTASAGRCRRSATWTASSTSSEMAGPNHIRRIAILTIVATADRAPARDLGARAGAAAGERERAGGGPGHRQHRPDGAGHAVRLLHPRLLRLLADRLPAARRRGRGGRRDPRRPEGADAVDRPHLRARDLHGRLRHLGAAPERLGRRSGARPDRRAARREASRCR